jgi:hypothetical protein
VSGDGSGRGAERAPRWDLLADVLADYVAGVLDGTPEADRIAARIAADPDWSTAHRALLVADARIRDRLADLADLTPAETMSADLASSLTAALATEPTPGGGPAEERDPAAVASLGVARRRAELRRRRVRLLSAVAAAVVVLAGVGGVLGLLNRTGQRAENSTAAGSADSPSGAGESGPVMGPNHLDGAKAPTGSGSAAASAADGPLTLLATGTDYRPDTVTTVLRTPTSQALPQQQDAPTAAPTLPPGAASRVPAGLSRLTGAAAFDDCLDALGTRFTTRPVLVDYARFQGGAALVTVIPTAQVSRPWIVVAGPACGTGTADVRYEVRAG